MPLDINNLIGLLGNAGNALGIQGDNPQGFNALQQIAASAPAVQAQGQTNIQRNVANLIQTPDFQQMQPADQQTALARLTGNPENIAKAVKSSSLAKLTQSPEFMSGTPQQQMGMVNSIEPNAGYALSAGQSANGTQTPWRTNAPQPTQSQSSPQAPQQETVGDKPINNPGNLRPIGASTGFRQFPTYEAGVEALTNDLSAKLSGNSAAMAGKTPTLRNIISTYSPANENDTNSLITKASTSTGLDPDQPLGMQHLVPIMGAIMKQEGAGGASDQGYASMAGKLPQPANISQQQQPEPPEPQEVTDLRNQISMAQRDRRLNPDPTKWAEQDAKIGDLQSKLLEFSPSVAAKRSAATSGQAWILDKNGTPIQPGNQANSTQPPVGIGSTVVQSKPILSSDGKPVLSEMPPNYVKPNRIMPDYGGDSTEKSIAASKSFLDTDQKSYGDMVASVNTSRKLAAQLDDVSDILRKSESGSAVAMWPELAKTFSAITGKTPKDLPEMQELAGNFLRANIGAIRDTNANLTGAPARTFGSEISHGLESYLSAENKPKALWGLITQVQGAIKNQESMLNDYTNVGALGNGLGPNGTTLPLDNFYTKWSADHPMSEAIKNVRESTPPFAGMQPQYKEGDTATHPVTGHKLTYTNGKWGG